MDDNINFFALLNLPNSINKIKQKNDINFKDNSKIEELRKKAKLEFYKKKSVRNTTLFEMEQFINNFVKNNSK